MSSIETPPPQEQESQPGEEREMVPAPAFRPRYPGAAKLDGRVALISGGDSGIGRAVALAMAREGARVAFVYLEEDDDAQDTLALLREEGSEGRAIKRDISSELSCQEIVEETLAHFGRLDILVNNAAEQHVRRRFEEITAEELERVFGTNVFGYFYLTKAALPHLGRGACIINTSSITAYKGHPLLIDYAATRGAIVSLTRSLSQSLLDRGIRVNAVAPGPIWTPLIPASFDEEMVSEHGDSAPLGRVGQPNEVAPSYVFLASEDASYMTGQVLHPNGGTVLNG
ncbi:SDR family oxidoreductase [Aquibaculum arenosum]|uniref:SDR family oxidoreductase n=1 Tax=Aquibaculum arenosum TaxID=3032591 RepID=A0ABT5YK58_9PROT|nr:SDR family oxidoreductase [Fodinicurvata sp. CAU 1616]MDF2095288.1 SDR family oxidoreductase [Fodinicurvata sp. CAU 1616]